MDVQLLKQVHDKRVDLWQQPNEEDDGETEGEDCGEKQKGLNVEVISGEFPLCCAVSSTVGCKFHGASG